MQNPLAINELCSRLAREYSNGAFSVSVMQKKSYPFG
jgi:hypothetical protein